MISGMKWTNKISILLLPVFVYFCLHISIKHLGQKRIGKILTENSFDQKVWQVGASNFFVYRVYFDPRFHHLTILFFRDGPDYLPNHFICYLFDSDRSLMEISQGVPVKAAYMDGVIMHCSAREVPKFLLLTNDTTISIRNLTRDLLIPVENIRPVPSEQIPNNLAACLSVLWGVPSDWLTILQYFEMLKLQGVTKFYVYHLESTEIVQKIIDYNIKLGFVELIHWPRIQLCQEQYWCQATQIQDCLYRTMFKHKYVAFHDYDEYIQPQTNHSLLDYLKRIDKEEYSNFLFRQKIFLREENDPPFENTTERDIEVEIPVVKYKNGSVFTPDWYGPKMVVKPDKVVALFVHWAEKVLAGCQAYSAAAESEAYLRHYREAVSQDGNERIRKELQEFGNFSVDPLPEILTTKLIENVKKVAEEMRKK